MCDFQTPSEHCFSSIWNFYMTAFVSKSWVGKSEVHPEVSSPLQICNSDASDEYRWAFKSNKTWLLTRPKITLDWRAAEIMRGTDEKPRSQMAQRKKWGYVTKRSCSFHRSTVKCSNGVMSKSLHPPPPTNYKWQNLYRFREILFQLVKTICWPLRPEGRRSTWPEWDARNKVMLFWYFLGGFFPPPFLTMCQCFWNVRPTTHKNADIQTSRSADFEMENKSTQLGVRKPTSVSAHSPDFGTLRFSFVTLTDIFMTLVFLASTSERCSRFILTYYKSHNLLKLLLF